MALRCRRNSTEGTGRGTGPRSRIISYGRTHGAFDPGPGAKMAARHGTCPKSYSTIDFPDIESRISGWLGAGTPANVRKSPRDLRLYVDAVLGGYGYILIGSAHQ